MSSRSDFESENLSPTEIAEKRIDQRRRSLNKHLGIGMVIGIGVSLLFLNTTPPLALFTFVCASLTTLASIPALAHTHKPVFPPILLGIWMGHIFGFMIAVMYVFVFQMSLLELALSV